MCATIWKGDYLTFFPRYMLSSIKVLLHTDLMLESYVFLKTFVKISPASLTPNKAGLFEGIIFLEGSI